ncbi:MAG: hypothetical protein MUF18_21035 [Fimbriiglobus sp.]|jgi:hypothetical protein|nr:hypothetical protein [Fimbriiglobus sp.]
MRKLFAALLAVAGGTVAAAANPTAGMSKGTPEFKAISALAFGPDGVLYVGDPMSGSITAIATGDTTSAGADDLTINDLGQAVGGLIGVEAKDAVVSDVKVNPASGNLFLAGGRKSGGTMLMKLDRKSGKVSEFPLKDVMFATVKLPNASEKNRAEAITSMAFVDGKLVVAGLSNEEFASTLRAIPVPFKDADKGTAVEIYHGAHGALETKAPVRTFTPYKVSGADYLIASYTCTPLVRIPLADLKPGTKVKGATLAELGNRNRPLDIIVYTKDKKDYALMANNARGVMKIALDGIDKAEGIPEKRVADKAGLNYETVKELEGVVQLDRLDADRAVIVVEGKDKSLSLKTIKLP